MTKTAVSTQIDSPMRASLEHRHCFGWYCFDTPCLGTMPPEEQRTSSQDGKLQIWSSDTPPSTGESSFGDETSKTKEMTVE